MARTVRDLLVALRGVAYTPRITTVVVAGTNDTVILKNDPSRVAWVIINSGPIDCFLLPLSAPVPAPTQTGVRVASSGGAVSAQFDEDGEIVAYEWHSVCVINTITLLTIFEAVIAARDKAV